MSDVVITGAGGRAGGSIIDHVDEYAFTPLDREPIPGIDSVQIDVEDLEALVDVFEGHHSVIHLAGDPDTKASWNSVLHNNIIGT